VDLSGPFGEELAADLQGEWLLSIGKETSMMMGGWLCRR
jgi:hypothetical protein